MHQLRKAQRCPGCGTHPDEWDPMHGGAVDAYVAVQRECPGCARTEKAQAELDRARERNGGRPGVRIQLRGFDPDIDDIGPGGD
jgi:hypothetical protein